MYGFNRKEVFIVDDPTGDLLFKLMLAVFALFLAVVVVGGLMDLIAWLMPAKKEVRHGAIFHGKCSKCDGNCSHNK